MQLLNKSLIIRGEKKSKGLTEKIKKIISQFWKDRILESVWWEINIAATKENIGYKNI